MKNIKGLKLYLFVFIFILLEEILFSFLTYKNIEIYHILFSLLYSSVIYFIYLFLYSKKTFLYFLNTCIFLIFISNYLYYVNYLSFIRIDVLFKSIKVLYFSSNIFDMIKNNIIDIILLLIPFVTINYLTYKDRNKNKFSFKYLFVLFIIYLIPITFMIFDRDDDIYSSKNLLGSKTTLGVKVSFKPSIISTLNIGFQSVPE